VWVFGVGTLGIGDIQAHFHCCGTKGTEIDRLKR